MSNVFIVNSSAAYADMFKRLGHDVVTDFTQAELVCFTGGEDVTPSMYGHAKHHTTWNNEYRDRYEADVYRMSRVMGLPMVGICRGAQFLNVMSGGEMYQDVSGHTVSHSITDLETGEVIEVSSTHHQMMKPSQKAILVASSTLGGDVTWWEGQVFKREVSNQDIEVVYYPETDCLCFQPHPEFIHSRYEGMTKYFGNLLERFLIKSAANCMC